MPQGYFQIIRHVRDNGRLVSPRGHDTFEAPDVVIRLNNPYRALAINTGRKLNLSIAAMEAVQLIGGFLDPKMMVSVSKNFEPFMDNGTFHGGYGERIGNQIVLVAQKLMQDNDTRQAVVQIWDKNKDNVPGMHDYPCTLSLTFQIRDDKLELHTTMRSNDVWLGLPYDIFQFTQLQITLARVLGFAVGSYFHHAISLHIYARDMDKITRVYSSLETVDTGGSLKGFGNHLTDGKHNVFGVLQRARWIGKGYEDEVHTTSPTEQWYIEQLKGHTTR